MKFAHEIVSASHRDKKYFTPEDRTNDFLTEFIYFSHGHLVKHSHRVRSVLRIDVEPLS